jgi:hypothetical protein
VSDITKVSLECSQRLTELIEFTCSPEFNDEMVVAREIFTLVSGKVNDDDFGYEQRMQLFQEFFLFEHRLCEPHAGYTIFELFLERAQNTRTPKEYQAFENFRSVYRSLFIVERSVGDDVEVCDLLGPQSQLVSPLCSFSLGGLPTDQIFEGRLIRYQGHHFFTGAFVFHTPSVRPLIQRVARSFLKRTQTRAAPTNGTTMDESWTAFLKRRFKVLKGLQNKRDGSDQPTKKRAIDQLTVARGFADVYQMVNRPDHVTAIGCTEPVSCFVSECPVVQRTPLLNALALCDVRCMRYRHIDPAKVYAQALASDAELLIGQNETAIAMSPATASGKKSNLKVIG